jgi:site-specific DNA recombinase
VAETLRALAAARSTPDNAATDDDISSKIAECDRKLAQYRAILDAGTNSGTVAAWIAEIEAEKASYALSARRPEPPRRMTEREINAIVEKFADIARVLTDADPDDKAEIFSKLGLKLTYHPGRPLVKAQIEASQHWQMESVRGVTAPTNQCLLAAEFALGHVA